MMRFVLLTAGKDLRRHLADPLALGIWVGVPIFIGLLMSQLAGGSGGSGPTARIWLVDRDQSALSQFLAGAAGGMGDGLLDLQEVTLEEGRARIDDGDGTAMLVLPEGFADAVLAGSPAELTLVKNPAQSILPAVVEDGLEMFVELAFYARRLLGEPLEQILQGPPEGQDTYDSATVAGLATEINDRIARAGEVLFPPLLQLEVVEEEEAEGGGGGGFDFAALLLPGLVLMSILFIAQGTSDDLWIEKRQGTLQRVVSSPRPASAYLGGKLLAATAVMATVALVALLVGVGILGLAPARVPLAVLWAAYSGATLACLFQALQLVGSSQRAASLVSNLVLFPLMMIGGSFFPFAAMPGWMAAVGRWTPNGLAVARLQELLEGGAAPAPLTLSALGMAVPAVLLFVLVARRIEHGFAAS